MKYILIALIFASSSAIADIQTRNIDHRTLMTKDTIFMLDKRAGKFWKVETNCNLPIKLSSGVRFISNSSVIKKGTQVTFLIDTSRNKHECSVQKVSLIS